MSGPAIPSDELTLSASEFKARCLEIMDRLNTGLLFKVTVTKRGTPVAEMKAAPRRSATSGYGSMKGSVVGWSTDRDLTVCDDDEWEEVIEAMPTNRLAPPL